MRKITNMDNIKGKTILDVIWNNAYDTVIFVIDDTEDDKAYFVMGASQDYDSVIPYFSNDDSMTNELYALHDKKHVTKEYYKLMTDEYYKERHEVQEKKDRVTYERLKKKFES